MTRPKTNFSYMFEPSLKQAIFSFMREENWDLSHFKEEEDLLNHLYFYWIRYSIDHQHTWCKTTSAIVFNDAFALSMKKRIKRRILLELKQKKARPNKLTLTRCASALE